MMGPNALPAPLRLQGKRVLVTGAGGFVGRALVAMLLEREGALVTALVRRRPREAWARHPNVTIATARDGDLDAVLAGVDVAVNLAYDFHAAPSALLAGFSELVTACARARVGGFVQFSSIAVYDGWPGADLTEESPSDGPGSAYKVTKRAMEQALAASALPHVILQPTVIYGPGSPQWTQRILEQFEFGRVVLPQDSGLAHAVFVDDVAEATILAAARAANPSANPSGRYIISGAEPVPWFDFYAAHAEIVGAGAPELATFHDGGSPAPNPLPAPGGGGLGAKARGLVRSALSPAATDALRRTLMRLRGRRTFTPTGSELRLLRARGSCSIARARADLGYEPAIGFQEGMARIAARYRPGGA